MLIKGELIQNAITGPSGTPAASKAAIKGITPQEQSGASDPKRAAARITIAVRPSTIPEIRWSSPVACAPPAAAIDNSKKGEMLTSAITRNCKLSSSCAVENAAIAISKTIRVR